MSRHRECHLPPVCTEPTLQIQNRGHYSLMEGDKSSFSMSGHVPYRLTDTAMASAASVFWIRRDLPRMRFKQVSEYSACEDCTHRQNSCSKAFSTLYTLAPHNFMAFHGGGGGIQFCGVRPLWFSALQLTHISQALPYVLFWYCTNLTCTLNTILGQCSHWVRKAWV